MPSHREIKDKARARLHEKMRVRARCYADGPEGESEDVWLRVNSKAEAKGDLAGTSLAYAERMETSPKLIFLHAEHTPARGNVYVVSAQEGYKVDSLEPLDGITVTAIAAPVRAATLAEYAPPED